jgi:hypothetical protein
MNTPDLEYIKTHIDLELAQPTDLLSESYARHYADLVHVMTHTLWTMLTTRQLWLAHFDRSVLGLSKKPGIHLRKKHGLTWSSLDPPEKFLMRELMDHGWVELYQIGDKERAIWSAPDIVQEGSVFRRLWFTLLSCHLIKSVAPEYTEGLKINRLGLDDILSPDLASMSSDLQACAFIQAVEAIDYEKFSDWIRRRHRELMFKTQLKKVDVFEESHLMKLVVNAFKQGCARAKSEAAHP